jgi:hypothetical protein
VIGQVTVADAVQRLTESPRAVCAVSWRGVAVSETSLDAGETQCGDPLEDADVALLRGDSIGRYVILEAVRPNAALPHHQNFQSCLLEQRAPGRLRVDDRIADLDAVRAERAERLA